MSVYTYVVDHENNNPVISAGDVINGGKLQAVMFDDALLRLEEAEAFLEKLRDDTTCDQTKYAIDDFSN